MLGYEDHGILTCMLMLDYGGTMQGFGGYAFDQWDGKRRVGGAFGTEFIARIMNVVGVDEWESLPGKYVRAVADHSKVYRIGHITEDKWMDPSQIGTDNDTET